jgi:hypothetical protein
LLCLLGAIAAVTYWEHWSVAQWRQPLQVVIYPVNGDGSDEVGHYITGLSVSQFAEIPVFIRKQSERYRLRPLPLPQVTLGAEVHALPPVLQGEQRSMWNILRWSLALRYYVFHNTPFWQSLGHIKLFVVFHQTQDGVPLESSVGLQKGLFGVIHAFADSRQNAQNNVVITHELLHTLGATDKYDAGLQPVYPDGFAEPDDGEHYPQKQAEIMAGRIPLSAQQAVMPANLAACVIGSKTAYEIQWR